MMLLLQIAVALYALALGVATLLPLHPSRVWWVRIWDFPRLHAALGFALLAPLGLVFPWPFAAVVVAFAIAGLVYQASWIRPYTRLAAREVEFAPDAPDGVTLLAVNVLEENTRHDLVRALIERVDPDVLLLMETDQVWTEAMEPVLARYATVIRDPRDDYYGMVFATRLEATEAKVVRLTHDETPALFAELVAPNGRPFVYIGLHPQPPTPDGADTDERDAQIVYAARFARKTDIPLVTMGDFNEAAWSRGAQQFKRVGGYVDPRIGRGLYASFHAEHMLIRCPIDQIYVTDDVAVVSIALGPKVGSDHFPMIARLRIDPELAAGLNTAPAPLDPAEVDRLDEIVAAYRRRLDAAALEAEANKAAS
jgi:endonuclease/exonuclease/phosphatase (EEP) superfamily protein YafD